jgi:hypothetical protein
MKLYVKILGYDVDLCDKDSYAGIQVINIDHVVHPLMYQTWQEYINATNNVWLHGLIINYGEREPV